MFFLFPYLINLGNRAGIILPILHDFTENWKVKSLVQITSMVSGKTRNESCSFQLLVCAFVFREGNGTSLQCPCLKNSMDRGAWLVTVCGVAKSWTQLSDFTFTFCVYVMSWHDCWNHLWNFALCLKRKSSKPKLYLNCHVCLYFQ